MVLKQPESLTGSIHLPDARLNVHLRVGNDPKKEVEIKGELPDARLNFHLSFGNGHKESVEIKGVEAKILGNILNQALRFSPELQEMVINFADYVKTAVEKVREGDGQDP